MSEARPLQFPYGIPGFDAVTEWELVSHEDIPEIAELVSTDGATSFWVTDPFVYAAGYAPDLPDADMADLGIDGPDQVIVLSVLRFDREERCAWLNLEAPIVINAQSGTGRQVILDRQGWSRRHRVSMED